MIDVCVSEYSAVKVTKCVIGDITGIDVCVSEYTAVKATKCVVGDITDAQFVSRALAGAHSVYHVAGVVSVGTFPDVDTMEAVNVQGKHNFSYYLQ